uniref:Ciliary microtubule inner protein 6 n=1 Tax=Pogona vitticeps TaxID=103695 RepID=A0A6J0V214_9SAUR
MFPNIVDMGRRRRAPPRQVPDTFRVFNIEFPERNKILGKIEDVYIPKNKQQRYTLEWRNNPHPIHAKCIKTNTKYFNEPIMYMDTEDTKTKQDHWWPSGEPFVQRPKPPYSKQSTQRNDFQKPDCMLSRPAKYHGKLQPSCGIVPLASPRPPGSLPRLFQEQLTFKQHYDARATPCIPYQGKKRGAFVWTEIKPEKGASVAPEGTQTRLCPAQGSALLEHHKTKKGSAAKNSTTSDCISSPVSQETLPDCKMALSKPDVMSGAKPALQISEKGQGSSEVFQTDKVDVSSPSIPLAEGGFG